MPMTDEEITKMKSDHENAIKALADSHKAELEKLKTQPKKDDEEKDDLSDKARKQRESDEGKAKYEKNLESALNFNLQAKDFTKKNEGLIPKSIEGIFAEADKEKYDSAIEKANAIKVGVVSEFFAVQANHDLLTSSQKVQLEEFLKLTKNGKQERVESVYAMIFEPTLEMLRRMEKAKQVNSGQKAQTDTEKQMVERMIKQSKKHYLGDKE